MKVWRLFLGLSILSFALSFQLQLWTTVVVSLFLGWKWAIEQWRLSKPPRWATNTLTALFLFYLLARYHTLFNQDAASSFLLVLTSLKLLEERTLRDQKFLFLMGFVVMASLLLYSIDLPDLVCVLAGFLFLWTAQAQQNSFTGSFLKALPLALLLFLFFPRVHNPFGIQGFSEPIGGSGFSGDMTPGSFEKINDNHELAFRVHFLGKNPRTTDQYWRGQVLHVSEGLRWTAGAAETRQLSPAAGPEMDYEITLEPHQHRWLFTWDPLSSLSTSEFGFSLRDHETFEANAPLHERVSYRGQEISRVKAEATDPRDLQVRSLSAAAEQWLHSLASDNSSREQKAAALMKAFFSQGFRYSKSPGRDNGDVDHFLKSKKGYCEHYAGAMATFLRAWKVPARVVIGYQGGQFNSYGRFWRFSQADAHAWVEYQDDQGLWHRSDPTSVVAPERLELGGSLFADLPEEWIGQNKALDFLRTRESWWIKVRDFASLNFENFNYELVTFLLDFDLEKQKELFKNSLFWISCLVLLLLLPLLAQSILRRRHSSISEWLLREILREAARHDLHPLPAESLREFVKRWALLRPAAREPLAVLLQCFELNEYAGRPLASGKKELRGVLAQVRGAEALAG